MLIIRLSRSGKKKIPHYKIVVIDSKQARDRKFIEKLGFYNPCIKLCNKSISINLTKYNYWLSKGCKLSNTVYQLIKKIKKNN